ncbi:MAG: ATP-dependent Clp protease proteolytic subunit [Kordiimonadales bacterium]|nr:MAG: ATP-dependent Clp protease proteolytic subunit [Kordiimonadales bacterium]
MRNFVNDDDEDKKKDESSNSEHLNKILFDARKVFVTGGINMEMATAICARLQAMAHTSDDPIIMTICSPGGHVEAGDMIHDTIKFIKPEVIVIGTGYVASAGALIYVAAEKKNRYTTPNTRFLLHQPSGGVGGDASSIAIQSQQIIAMRDRLNAIFAKATGQKVDKVAKDVDRDFWLTAKEAVKYGIVGKIIENETEIK